MSMISTREPHQQNLSHRVSGGIVGDAINAARLLIVDAVERANSGDPGAAMALAPLVYGLPTRHIRHNAEVPGWVDRDRLVLSIGDALLLLYSALHLAGYDLSVDDIAAVQETYADGPLRPRR